MEQYLAPAEEKQLISSINNLLNTSKTRCRGFKLLTELLPRLSTDSINEHAITWTKCCSIQHGADPLKEVKLATLVELLNYCCTNQDFNKKFMGEHLAKVLETCMEPSPNFSEAEVTMDCLTVVLNKYPNWFHPHMKKVENFLLKFLDHTCDSVVRKSALAFLYLQQSGGGGLNGINYVNNFTTSFRRLCQTASLTLYDMFGDILTSAKDKAESGFSPYMPTLRGTGDSSEIGDKSARRLINCLQYMKVMLWKRFAATKVLNPKVLLDLIGPGLSVHICVSGKNIPEESNRSMLLKKIQVHLLYLLKSAISFLDRNTLPYSYSITKILVNTLDRNEKCTCYKLDLLYQCALHATFRQWLHLIKDLYQRFQMPVFTAILSNIRPLRTHVSLNLDVNMSSERSKKRKRKTMEDKTSGSQCTNSQLSTNAKTLIEKNAAISLRTTRDLLLAIPVGLDQELLLKLYKVILGAALDILVGRPVDPYNSLKCQWELFEVVPAFLEQESVGELISIHHISQILSAGATNINKNISVACKRGLGVLEKISQPVCPYISSDILKHVGQDIEESNKEFSAIEIVQSSDDESYEIAPQSDLVCLVNSAEKGIENSSDMSISSSDMAVDENNHNKHKVHILDVTVVKPGSCSADDVEKANDNTTLVRDKEEKIKVNEHCNSNGDSNNTNNCEDDNVVMVCESESEGEVEFVKEQIVIDVAEKNNIDDDVIFEDDNTNLNLLNKKVHEVIKIDDNEIFEDNSTNLNLLNKKIHEVIKIDDNENEHDIVSSLTDDVEGAMLNSFVDEVDY